MQYYMMEKKNTMHRHVPVVELELIFAVGLPVLAFSSGLPAESIQIEDNAIDRLKWTHHPRTAGAV